MGGKENPLENGQIYIYDERLIGDVPEVEPAEEIAEVVKPLTKSDSVELTLTFTPEQAAIIAKGLQATIERITRLLQCAVEAATEAFRKLAAAITPPAADVMDRLLYEANDNPKWWHLYKHAKKYRVRKKYRRLLMKRFFRKLEAAQKYKEVRE